jgi:hypothetical protein
VPESFTAVAAFTVGEMLCSTSSFQSGPSDAVRVPERLSGRIAPSVFTSKVNSPASIARPRYSISSFSLRALWTEILILFFSQRAGFQSWFKSGLKVLRARTAESPPLTEVGIQARALKKN